MHPTPRLSSGCLDCKLIWVYIRLSDHQIVHPADCTISLPRMLFLRLFHHHRDRPSGEVYIRSPRQDLDWTSGCSVLYILLFQCFGGRGGQGRAVEGNWQILFLYQGPLQVTVLASRRLGRHLCIRPPRGGHPYGLLEWLAHSISVAMIYRYKLQARFIAL